MVTGIWAGTLILVSIISLCLPTLGLGQLCEFNLAQDKGATDFTTCMESVSKSWPTAITCERATYELI